jgi:hypothetical protein
MAENKILKATSGIVQLLEPLESEERIRAVQAALTLLGEGAIPKLTASDRGGNGDNGSMTEQAYFDAKEPGSKMHQLAVAARYREEHLDAVATTKAEMQAVFKEARRNFDSSNYPRDLNNARDRGIFNRDTGKDSAVLSHRGQNFVDALPDQDAAKKILKGYRKKKTTNKKTTKKS